MYGAKRRAKPIHRQRSSSPASIRWSTVGLSWRNLGHALGTPADSKDWGVLYLGSAHAAKEKGPLVALDGKGEPLPDQRGARAGLKGLIALDGNWAQAKALWWRNAWLTRLRRFVVVPDGPSLYGDLRREARPDAVSTLEAVGLALGVLEGNAAVRENLLVPFRALLAKARAEKVQAVDADYGVYKSDDAGETWRLLWVPPLDPVVPANPNQTVGQGDTMVGVRWVKL